MQLVANHDFLALTLANPIHLDPMRFVLPQGTQVEVWDTGVILFEPPEGQHIKNIVLSSGIHGNETAPVEICNQLIRELLSGQLQTQHRVLFIFGNPAAICLQQREVKENLNRLFSGAYSEGEGIVNRERIRAQQLERYLIQFFEGATLGQGRYHYDLHTAIRASKQEKFAVYPWLHGREHCREQLSFLGCCGVNTILLSDSATTTFSYFSSTRFGAHAFTVELGKVQPFGQNDMTRFTDISQMLRALMSQSELSLPSWDEEQFLLYRISRQVTKTSDNFRFLFSGTLPNFSEFAPGTLLAVDGELEHHIGAESEAVVFPNAKVANGHRACLLVSRTHL